jgi:uncharacterized protein (DUF2342 family)
MPRKAHQPDPVARRQVEAMAAYGVPETDIARVVAIDPKTLRKHYRDELDTGAIKANSRIAESLYKKATGEGPQSVTACIFWLKTRAHWKETTVNEVTVTTDPLTRLMQDIAERGRRIHDPRPPVTIDGTAFPLLHREP